MPQCEHCGAPILQSSAQAQKPEADGAMFCSDMCRNLHRGDEPHPQPEPQQDEP